jgi:hypothetical protein
MFLLGHIYLSATEARIRAGQAKIDAEYARLAVEFFEGHGNEDGAT